MALPCCTATTRRVVNERPSRMRSTSYTIGTRGSPGRMKYECSECTRRSTGTVRPAATRAWPATCPPKTRTGDSAGDTPRKMFSSMRSRSSNATRSSTADCPLRPEGDMAAARAASVTAELSLAVSQQRQRPRSLQYEGAGPVQRPRLGVVVLTQAVHPDEVRRPDGAGRRSGDDHHEVADGVTADLQHGRVDLADHLVGRLHARD